MELVTDKMIAEKEDCIGWITFNNPEKRNAMSLQMWEALATILENFEADETVRVIVLRGAGGKAFVSGVDISEFETKRNSAAAEEEYNRISSGARSLLVRSNKPLLAMIQGFCIGGGMAVALTADVRFATTDSKFGIPAARLGLGYGFEGVKALIDLVGPANAKDILFSARFLDADEALRIGLINRIVSTPELVKVVRDYAKGIANNAPLTIRTAKVAAREALKDPAKRDLENVAKMVAECFDSQDYAEGRRAFMEKRSPVFRGK